MNPRRLDHVALWVSDPERLADWTESTLGMHVIERTDDFVLAGWDGRRGKLTFFAADGPRRAGPLDRIVVSVEDGEGRVFELEDELVVETRAAQESDLSGVVLRSPDPERAAAEWQRLGLSPAPGRGVSVAVGEATLDLSRGSVESVEQPLLNHLGVLVESAADELAELRSRDIPIADIVDAPNTYAVFVEGPDGVRLEYVEHKESFSLT